ncbi:MAG: hypothetical protein ABI557_06630 [Aureliella sp.]
MPGNFEGFGIAFLYPDSWTLELDEEARSVSLESPEGSFFTVTRFENAVDADTAIERGVSAMQQEYDEVENEAWAKTIAGLQLEGSLLRFVYLDLIITSQLLAVVHGGVTYLVQIQAEDRDHERLEPVFDAMLTSLCQNLAACGATSDAPP